jgi:hypothetical protein
MHESIRASLAAVAGILLGLVACADRKAQDGNGDGGEGSPDNTVCLPEG